MCILFILSHYALLFFKIIIIIYIITFFTRLPRSRRSKKISAFRFKITRLFQTIEAKCNVNSLNLTYNECLGAVSSIRQDADNEKGLWHQSNVHHYRLVFYHTYWMTKNELDDGSSNENDEIILNYEYRTIRHIILSYLATQNGCCSKLIVWKSSRQFSCKYERRLRSELKNYAGRFELRLFVSNLYKRCVFIQMNCAKSRVRVFLQLKQIIFTLI